MPVSLTNSIDIVANSVSLYDANQVKNILDLFLKKTDAITQIIGVPPETLNTIQKLAESINNDQTFYNTINNKLDTKANSADVYNNFSTFSQTEINALLSAKQASITSTTALSLSSITTSGSMTANKIITRYFEPPTGSTDLNFNASSTAVMTLTSLLIRLMQPVQIDQGCKIQNNMSLGSYSPSNPTLWIETTAIQNGSITTSNNITAGVNIYATDGLIKGKNLEITSTSSFTGTMTANTINLSSITYNDSSGLDRLTIKSALTFEFRDKINVPLFSVSSNANTGITINTDLLIKHLGYRRRSEHWCC